MFDYMSHPPLWKQAENWSRIYVPQVFLGWLLRTRQSAIGRFLLTSNWLKENTLAHHVLVIPEMSSFLVYTGIEALSSVPVSEAYSNSTFINVYIKEKVEKDQLSSFFQDLLERYSKLIHQLADVDSKDTSSTLSIHTATLSRALQKKNSYDPIGSLHSGSNGSLNHALDVSGNWASLGSSLGEEDPDSFSSSMTSLSLKRRMTRSRSLDDMLDVNMRQKRASKKATSKRRVGSSKFYTEQILNVINKGKYVSLPFFFSDHCSRVFPRHG